MRPRPFGLGPIVVALLLGIAAATACKKQAPGTAAPADGGGAMPDTAAEEPATEEPAGADDLGGMEADLDRLESELAAAGSEIQSLPESADPKERQTRCQRICDLADAVCDLESRICALADEHTGEDRYAAACARAGGDCERATEACRECSG